MKHNIPPIKILYTFDDYSENETCKARFLRIHGKKTGTEENPYPCVSSRFVADDLILSVVLAVVKVFVGFIHHVLKAYA